MLSWLGCAGKHGGSLGKPSGKHGGRKVNKPAQIRPVVESVRKAPAPRNGSGGSSSSWLSRVVENVMG